MGSRKLWLKENTTYCFDKFTKESLDKGQDRWYLPCNKNGMLAVPRVQRGMGGDIVNLWFEEAQADDPKLWGAPMNLQNFRSNLSNKAKQFLESSHNPENVVAPARIDEGTTDQQQQQQHEGGANTIPYAATVGAVLPSDTTGDIVKTTDNQGNMISLIYLQCMYKSCISGTSGSINNCHIAIQAPLGWKIGDQNKPDFCTLSSDKKHLVLNVKALPDLFDRNTPRKLLCGIFSNIYKDFLTRTEHPAVTAIRNNIDAEQKHPGGEITTPSFLMNIPLMCECNSIGAIDGLHHDWSRPPALKTAPAPVVRQSLVDYCSHHS
jgi:hypothetical protein